jgi:glycosyltransferase involved in cell wall biosynthesis
VGMPIMRVLFQSRKTLFEVPGGDTVQLVKTKEYLERLGITVDISTELQPDLSAYDIVHLFNLTRPQEVLVQARNAVAQGKSIVLSTIYVDYEEYEKKARHGIAGQIASLVSSARLEYLKTIARAVKNRELHKGTLQYLRRGHGSSLREILSLVAVCLPNSESEMTRLAARYPEASRKRYLVVPNAVDVAIFDPEHTVISEEVARYRGCVLCVARYEGRKNQLNLIRAMKGLPWPLVLIGKAAPNHRGYLEQMKAESGPNVHYIDQVDHHKLPEYYEAAKVHCLVSWMETTGLSSLEAGVMGCNLVITDKGDTRDYFGNLAFYCDPNSVPSIREAVVRAYQAPVPRELRQRILDNFVWERTARATLEGYRLAALTQ